TRCACGWSTPTNTTCGPNGSKRLRYKKAPPARGFFMRATVASDHPRIAVTGVRRRRIRSRPGPEPFMNTPYRREGDTWQIDLRLDRLQQLADTRDPSPFIRRDLDPDAERYILDACRELPAYEPLALNLWLPAHELSAETAERARHTVCFHFAWRAENSQRRL